jgi:hypothetical protein
MLFAVFVIPLGVAVQDEFNPPISAQSFICALIHSTAEMTMSLRKLPKRHMRRSS